MARAVAINLIGRDVSLSKTLQGAGKKFTDLRKTIEHANRRQREAMETMATGATVAGTALVAGFGLAVKATMDFDSAMSNVGAVSNASAKDMEALRKAALKAGADTKYSATEAAKAEAELAKVGISTADIMGGALTGSLSLAAAGQLDLEEAAVLAGQSMKIFNLEGKDVGRVADTLAAGANKSAADVHQLGESLRAGGNTAAQFGLGLEDTVGVLAAFSDNALIGSDAGTSLKTMLMHLANPTMKTQGLMEELGISAYDVNGNFVGMADLAEQLRTKLSGLSQQQRDQAIAQIFGSDAMRGAAILYKLGAKGVEEYTQAVSDQGAAARVASKNMDNLAGDVEQLKGSIETALINGGSAATGSLRTLVQWADNAVDAFNKLPGPVQGGAVAVSGIAGAALLAVGGFVYLVPKIAEVRGAMTTLGITADTLKVKLATLGKAALWITAIAGTLSAVNSWRDSLQGAAQTTDDLTQSLDELARTGKMTGAMADQWTGLFHGAEEAPKRFADAIREVGDPTLWERAISHPVDSMADALPFLDGGFQKLAEKVHGVDVSLAQMAKSGNLEQAKAAFTQITKQAQDAGVPLDKLKEVFPEYTSAAGSSVAKTAAAATAQQRLAEKANASAEAMRDARTQVEWFNQAAADAEEAQINFEESLDDAASRLKENGRTLDVNTEKGRSNRNILREMAHSAASVAEKVFDETGSVDDANAAFKTNVDRMKGVLTHAGFTKKEVKEIINAYLKVPKQMRGMASDVESALNKIKKKRQVVIGVLAQGDLIGYKLPGGKSVGVMGGKSPIGMAIGGEVPMMPGASRHKDSVHALLRVGEHVWTPEEVAKVGGQQKMLQLRKAVMTGQVQLERFATGGAVGYPKPAASTSMGNLGVFTKAVNTHYNAIANQVGKDLSAYLNKVWGGPGKKAVRAARSQIGLPYSWGGGGPHGPSYGFAQGAGIRGFDCCMTPDTLVQTTSGPKRIIDVTAGDEVYTWKNGNLGRNRVVARSEPRRQMTYRLRTNRRSVDASANHPFLVVRTTPYEFGGKPVTAYTEWVRLEHLKPGDKLVTLQSLPDDGAMPDDRWLSDPDYLWLLGAMFGDGSLSKAKRSRVYLCLYGENRARAQETLQRLIGKTAVEHPTHGMYWHDMALAAALRRDGLALRSTERTIPAAVWTLPHKLIEAFLDGYTTADGHVVAGKNRAASFTYAAANRPLIEQVRNLHLVLGHNAAPVREMKRTPGPIIIKGKEVVNPRPLWGFYVTAGSTRRAVAITRTAALLEMFGDSHFMPEKVLSITELEVNDTYDIEVEGAHNFIANGVVAHNSSLMQYGWYKATGKVIPRTTYSQYPWTRYTSSPKPGDLGFMNFSSSRGLPEHVVMKSDKPHRIIEAPHTGAYVREVAARPAHWGRPPIARAMGGPVRPGQTYLVGERRPELLRVGASGHITPTTAAGGAQVVEVRLVLDGRADSEMLRMLRKMVRVQGGGDVQVALGNGRR